MSSLQTFEHDWWDDRVGGEATVLTEVECAAVATVASTSEGGEKNGAGLVVEGIKVRRVSGLWVCVINLLDDPECDCSYLRCVTFDFLARW
jgi:hypothetical protein